MDSFALWLQEQKDSMNFKRFMGYIIEQRDYKLKESLAKGDTDFAKGQYKALNWVTNLPEELLESFKRATDT